MWQSVTYILCDSNTNKSCEHHSNSMCRSILGHAPIGSYFQRFNIDESHRCECGVPLQTRNHIFVACRKHKLLHGDRRVPKYIGELWYFLDMNPKAFAQRTPGPLPEGVGWAMRGDQSPCASEQRLEAGNGAPAGPPRTSLNPLCGS